MTATSCACVFSVEGNTAYPTSLAAGPWDSAAQHGGAPAALIVWLAERHRTDDLRISRLSLDLLRPAPIAPLSCERRIIRAGRRIQVSEIILTAGGVDVVRATIVETRDNFVELPYSAATHSHNYLCVAESRAPTSAPHAPSAFLEGVNMRIARGEFSDRGLKAIWYRIDRTLISGHANSGAMRAAAIADFSNGTSSPLNVDDWTFINADLTLNMVREPVGDWILSDAQSWLSNEGRGVAVSRLADEQGYFGHASQSLLIARR